MTALLIWYLFGTAVLVFEQVSIAWGRSQHLPNRRINTDNSARMIGIELNILDAPYLINFSDNVRYLAPGTIISPTRMLTAAHVVARAGATNIMNDVPSYHGVSQILIHPKYDDVIRDYDVAILVVQPTVNFDLKRQPIVVSKCGPVADDDLLTAGWGATSPQSDNPNNHLLCANVTILAPDKCKSLATGFINFNADTMLCSTGGPCNKDDGGPLFSIFHQFGVIINSTSCTTDATAFYINLGAPEIWNWIQQNKG